MDALEIVKEQRRVYAEAVARALTSPLYAGPLLAASELTDPDGPLVPLPAKPEPVRVVPEFPLAAYRVLVA